MGSSGYREEKFIKGCCKSVEIGVLENIIQQSKNSNL